MEKGPILLAVSGGLDSMVMLDKAVKQYGAEHLAVAHCNFKLRGEESDGDEEFVGDRCQELGVKFHAKSFDTAGFSSQEKMSIQQAARELRYEWFFSLLEGKGYSMIATAHHKDDSMETFFINLFRGSGPKGLSGIQNNHGRAITRPLLGMSKKEIEHYAQVHSIDWREDSSNTSDKYLRNRIRLELMPLLKDLKPEINGALNSVMEIQSELSEFLEDAATMYKAECFSQHGENIHIRMDGSKFEKLFLRTALREYSFSDTQLQDLLLAKQSGKQVHSGPYVLTRDREELILSMRRTKLNKEWQISEDLDFKGLGVSAEIIEVQFSLIDPDPKMAFIDYSKLTFPLTVRPWKSGDRFQPLGMKSGSKKVSDFLVDAKVPIEEKKQTLVLLSGEEIVWLVGHRISERFKCISSESLSLVLKVES